MEEYESLLSPMRDRSPADSQRRKMSFNPMDGWTPPHVLDEPVGAFEVSRAKRIGTSVVVRTANIHADEFRVGQVAAAVVYCLFAAGIVFGYAALKPVLIREGVYRGQCTKEELDDNVRVCYAQEIQYVFLDVSVGQ